MQTNSSGSSQTLPAQSVDPFVSEGAPLIADAAKTEESARQEKRVQEIADSIGVRLRFKRRRDGTATVAIIDGICPICALGVVERDDDEEVLKPRTAYIVVATQFLRCRNPDCPCGSPRSGTTMRGRPRGLALEEWYPLVDPDADEGRTEAIARVEANVGATLRNVPLTDAGNAERLTAHCRADVRYVEGRGWATWDRPTRTWVFDDSRMLVFATATCRTTYAAAPSDESGDSLRRHARRSESATRLAAMVKLASTVAQIRLPATDFDANPGLLAVLDKVIDLRTGMARDRTRSDFVTRVAPVRYDPSATCPRWEQFLAEILDGNTAVIAFIQRIVGYTLTGWINEACLFLLIGLGRNGKTVLVEVVRALMGQYASAADFTTFVQRRSEAARNDLARLQSVRFVTASESARGVVLDEALVKAITGGDTIAARFLYREFTEFRPVMKVWLVSNHLPTIRGDDLGIWRRIRLIRLAKPIAEDKVDPRLTEKLMAELPGILNWAVAGAVEWHRIGLAPPEAVLSATADFREGMDTLGAFLDTRCERGPALQAPASHLHEAYRKHMQAAGEQPLSPSDLAAALRARGFIQERTNAGRRWIGLRLREVTP